MKQGRSRVSFYHRVRCRYWDQMRTSELWRDTVPIQSEHRRVSPQRQGGIPESLIRTQGLQVARHWIIHRELVLQRWENTRLESGRWEWVYISRGGGVLLRDVLPFTLCQVPSGAVVPYVEILICHSIIKKTLCFLLCGVLPYRHNLATSICCTRVTSFLFYHGNISDRN